MALEKSASIKITGKTEGATQPLSKLKDQIDKNKDSSEKAGVSFGKMAASAAKVGAAALGLVGVLAAVVNSTTKQADEMIKSARAAGVQADAFQRLNFAAGRTGVSMDTLSAGLRRINVNMLETAAGGGKQFTHALSEIGLTVDDLKNKGPEEQLGILSDALNTLDDEAVRVAVSSKIFGKSAGPELATLISEGSAGLQAMSAEAERLGLVLSEDSLKASEEFQDTLADTKLLLQSLVTDIGMAALPAMQDILHSFKEWAAENRELIRTKITEFVKQLADLLTTLAPVLVKAVEHVGALAGVVATLAENLGPTGLVASAGAARIAITGVQSGMISLVPHIAAVSAALLIAIGLYQELSSSQAAWENELRKREFTEVSKRKIGDQSTESLMFAAEMGNADAEAELRRRADETVSAMFREAEAEAVREQAELESIRRELAARKAARGGGRRGVTDPHAGIAAMLGEDPGKRTSGHALLGLADPTLIDPFSPEETARREQEALRHEQAIADIQFNERMRSIELQRASGVEPLQLIELEEQARIAFLEGELQRSNDEIERSLIRDQMEQVHHDARIERMRLETAEAEKQRAAKQRIAVDLIRINASVGHAFAASMFDQSKSVAEHVKLFAKAGAERLTAQSITHFLSAAAYAINPLTAPLAAAEATAGGIAAAGAASLGAMYGIAAAAGGGRSTAPPATDFGGSSGSGMEASRQRNARFEGAPISREGSHVPRRQVSKANAEGLTINVTTNSLGKIEQDEVILAVRQALAHHEQVNGGAN